MDDLVDLELEKIDNILSKINNDKEPDYIKEVERKTWIDLYSTGLRGRRTGAGFTALGDTLAALGYKYDSAYSLSMIEQIMRSKFSAELESTIDLAVERGAFQAFDAKLEEEWSNKEGSFFYMIKNEFPELWTKMQRYGRRNISWSTVAPNGSLSLLAQLDDNHFGTTSGVEPLFKVYHIRRKKINPNDKNARVDFVDDLGDKWQEFGVFHEGFKMWYDINCPDGKSITELTKDEIDEFVKKSPYYNSSAEEINWVKRIEIQAIIQKYITHSISSTINLPENISVDEVSKIYFEAWKKGLKGITIYRSGSRSGVLIEKKDNSLVEKEQFSYYDAPKRPKEIDGELHIVSVKGQKYCVLIGFFDNKPYELFAFIASEDIIKEGNSKGKIVKVKRGHYNYYSGDNKLRHVEFAASTPSEQVFTRLISGMLRHGVNPEYIIEQIDKCPLEIVSFGKAISRILKKYIKLTRNQDEKWCENDCKIVHEEGCAKCLTCGQSICK